MTYYSIDSCSGVWGSAATQYAAVVNMICGGGQTLRSVIVITGEPANSDNGDSSTLPPAAAEQLALHGTPTESHS